MRALCNSYASVPAVQSVKFLLEPGRVPGYLGPNGLGKSTTVKTLNGCRNSRMGKAWLGCLVCFAVGRLLWRSVPLSKTVLDIN